MISYSKYANILANLNVQSMFTMLICPFNEQQAKVDTPPVPKPTMAATAATQPAKTATPPLTGIGERPFCHRSKIQTTQQTPNNPKHDHNTCVQS